MIIEHIEREVELFRTTTPPDIDGTPQPAWVETIQMLTVTQDMIIRPLYMSTESRWNNEEYNSANIIRLKDGFEIILYREDTARAYFRLLNTSDFEGKDIGKELPECKI